MGIMVSIVIDPDFSGSEKQLVRQYLPAHSYAVVTDDNTYMALGKRVVEALSATGEKHIPLGLAPKASVELAQYIREACADNQAIIAVGSGTINDLCKYAAAQDNKPYAVFATAPSMNGYVSATASLWVEGQKRSLAAQPPQALFCDLGVLANAPLRLIRSGLGDSLCRTTTQADWLLSHLLLGTHYDEEPFRLVAEFEAELFEHAAGLAERDKHAIALLMQTLIASGKGMLLSGGSFPASQGEHMLEHTMEMLYGATLPHHYHGEQIGVLTLLMSNLQRKFLTRAAPPKLTYHEPPEAWRNIYHDKIPDAGYVASLNEKLAESWDEICSRISTVTLQPLYLRDVLETVSAPSTLEDLGWEHDATEQAAKLTPYTRNRFTFLDLALLAGMEPILP